MECVPVRSVRAKVGSEAEDDSELARARSFEMSGAKFRHNVSVYEKFLFGDSGTKI